MRITRTFLLGATALVLAMGCAPSNPGMVADGVLTLDSMCLLQISNPLLVEGTLDLTPRTSGIHYLAGFHVGNQLINNGNRVYPLMADPNVIVFDHVEVTLLDTNEAPLNLGQANPYLVPASGTAGSTTGTDPTFGIAAATVIPDAYGQLLSDQFAGGGGGTIIVRARVIGTTSGGSVLTSGPILFPIRLCVGCLFQCAVDEMGMGINAPSCLPGQDNVSQVACTP